MRLPDEDLVDAAMQAYWDHSWRGQRPMIYEAQMPELLAVLMPVLDEFARKRSRVPARKLAKVDKGSQQEGRRLVKDRSGGRCEISIVGVCTGRAQDWHHRVNKGQGGTWYASNGMHGCRACHAHVTVNPREAKANGWTVAPGVTPPVEVPVMRRGQWVFLDDDGGFEPVEKGAA